MPVLSRKQSERLAETLNSPPLTWMSQCEALRNGMMPGSRRWTSAPRDRKSNAPDLGMFRPVLIVQFSFNLQVILRKRLHDDLLKLRHEQMHDEPRRDVGETADDEHDAVADFDLVQDS
jgi:hypothetical protein